MKIETDDIESESSLIDLTPLVDVVFLLLIFFMVTATFQIDERDLAITIPEAENGNPLTDLPETMFVGVRKDGRYSVGTELLDREELRQVLVRAKRKNEKQKVIIRSDAEAPFKYPHGVFDLCAGIGIETSMASTEKLGG